MKKVSITRVKRLYLCCIQINVVDSHFGEHFLCVVIHTNDKHRLYVSRRCFCFIIIQRKELLTMPIIDVKATGNNIKNIIRSKVPIAFAQNRLLGCKLVGQSWADHLRKAGVSRRGAGV